LASAAVVEGLVETQVVALMLASVYPTLSHNFMHHPRNKRLARLVSLQDCQNKGNILQYTQNAGFTDSMEP
jgi:hypothetical protein